MVYWINYLLSKPMVSVSIPNFSSLLDDYLSCGPVPLSVDGMLDINTHIGTSCNVTVRR